MNTILVTGAAGFIGRRCLPLLAARGFEVHAVSAKTGRAEGATWHACDLLAAGQPERLLAAVRPSHLLHLAWIATPGIFWTSPVNAAWQAASARLFEAFYRGGGRRAVGAGSCAEYAPSDSPCREGETPIAPPTPYGRAKAAACDSLEAAAGGHGTWAWARLFFPYGPGEPPGRFIPSVIDGLLRGATVDCTHGKQVRDFVYVDDVAAACVALAAGEASGACNVGSGRGASLREVAGIATGLLGRAELVRFGVRPVPEFDPPSIVADPARLREQHGWQASVALEDGIQRTIAAARQALQGKA